MRLLPTSIDGSSLVAWSAMRSVLQTRSLTEPTYLFVMSTFSTLPNNGALRCFTYSLQDGCLACICPSYDKHSELDLWNSRLGLFRVHWSDGLEEQRVALIDLIPSSIDCVNPLTNTQYALTKALRQDSSTRVSATSTRPDHVCSDYPPRFFPPTRGNVLKASNGIHFLLYPPISALIQVHVQSYNLLS